MSIQASTRRRNPLTGEYVLVSPLRMDRPWSQKTETVSEPQLPEYEPNCYLCPRNTRSNGQVNPDYHDVFVFENDFPALSDLSFEQVNNQSDSPFFHQRVERGICEVVCFSPKHNAHFSMLSISEVSKVIATWTDRYRALSQIDGIQYIQIFETRGKEVGNSSPHPHSQIWAQESIPTLPAKMIEAQEEYFQECSSQLLLDYVHEECEAGDRVITEIGDFVLLVPYWAEWPYETYILPKKHIAALTDLSDRQRNDLAEMISIAAKMYASFFQRSPHSAPYMLSIFQKPTATSDARYVQLFLKFITPMLSSARQKYQAGYEKSAEPQRDLTPETAAGQLRDSLNGCV